MLHVEQHPLPHRGRDGLAPRAQQQPSRDPVGHRPADPGGAFGSDCDGWVLPAGTWIPLSRFPLEAHQERTAYVATHGLLRRILPHERLRGPSYVNSVLYLPDGRRPGGRPVGDDGSRAHRTTPT